MSIRNCTGGTARCGTATFWLLAGLLTTFTSVQAADVYNVTKLELQSSFNPIREIADNVIWEQGFDGSCGITDVKTSQDDFPFSWETQFTTTVRATIGKCPANPVRDPDQIKWETKVRGQPDSKKLKGDATGTSTVDVKVKMPDTVGVYLVDFNFTVIVGKCETKKTITRKLFVTIGKTVRTESGTDNKRIWFLKACTWASGATTKEATVDNVRHGFYLNNGPIAIHYTDNPSRTWQQLVEPTNTTKDGNCYVFSSVVKNMSRVLGVDDLGWDPYKGKYGKGLVTYTNPVPNNRSLDNGFPGNATADPTTTPIEYDRYRFANHSLMRRGSAFHDATYDGKYGSRVVSGSTVVKGEDFVRWHITDLGTPQETEENDGTRGYDIKRLTGVKSARDWQAYHYKAPPSPWLTLYPEGGPDLASLTAFPVGNGRTPMQSFTNSDSFYVVDDDFDGLGDALAVDVQYLAPLSGDYSFEAYLEYNGLSITDRARFKSQEPTYFDYTGPAGTITAHFEFSGEEIYQSGYDGSFMVTVEALYDTIVLDTHTVGSPYYNHTDFGEFGVQFGSVTDEGVDTDIPTNGLSDVLRAHVEIMVRRAGTYQLSGVLLADTVIVTSSQISFTRSAGTHTLDLDVAGPAIRAGNADGPYELMLTLSRGDGEGIVSRSFTTGSYSAPDFDLSDARINSINFVPTDVDGDTYYDILRADLTVDADESDTYSFIGTLQTTGGVAIASAAAGAALSDEIAVVSLHFDGLEIFESGEDGPYRAVVIVTDGDDTDETLGFLTPAYLNEQFDAPCVEADYCVAPIVVPGVTSYQHTASTCCATDIVPCVPRTSCGWTGNPDSCHCSGGDVVYLVRLLSAGSLLIQLQGPDTSDEQLSVFTDCDDPFGSCVGVADEYDANLAGEALSLSLASGNYYIATSHAGNLACGDLTLTIDSDIPLPVALTGFDAIAGDGRVLLRWSTASETQNDRFEIERDGLLIARIPTQGNANGAHNYQWTDAGLQNGLIYRYGLFAVDLTGTRQALGTLSAVPRANPEIITEYALYQNYPNPFNPTTSIAFDLVENGFVNLTVYNLMGQRVSGPVDANLSAGRHTIVFDATGLPSGVYLYRLETNGFVAEKKMLLMK